MVARRPEDGGGNPLHLHEQKNRAPLAEGAGVLYNVGRKGATFRVVTPPKRLYGYFPENRQQVE